MIDLNREMEIHVGDRVNIGQQNFLEGSVEAIRVIADGNLVENYIGTPDRIVVTVQLDHATVNKRGFEITSILS